LLQLLLGLALL
jgi:hypothetical protein